MRVCALANIVHDRTRRCARRGARLLGERPASGRRRVSVRVWQRHALLTHYSHNHESYRYEKFNGCSCAGGLASAGTVPCVTHDESQNRIELHLLMSLSVSVPGFLVFAPESKAATVASRAMVAAFDAQAAINSALGNAVGADNNYFIAGAQCQCGAATLWTPDLFGSAAT